ncbi:MAG: DNA-directed RNA polymerase subunit P [archaeon]
MVVYKCFGCGKEIKIDLVRKKIRCPYCGSKILYKTRTVHSKVKAV